MLDRGPVLTGWTTWVLVKEITPEIVDWLVRSTEAGADEWFCLATDAPVRLSTPLQEAGTFGTEPR